jgi:pilus assembly protein Flp/PilA
MAAPPGGTVSLARGGRDMKALQAFLADQSGATATEYGLITAGMTIAIITVVIALGSQLKSIFTLFTSDLQATGK